MSGTLTLVPGQVFTGGSTVGALDTGQIAFTQTGNVIFNTSVTPNTMSEVDISKDVLASSQSFNGGTLESVTIGTVTPGSTITLTTADLPPGISIPPGFTLPQTDIGTVFTVTADVSIFGSSSTLTGSAAILGVDGPLVLVGDIQVQFNGQTLNAGAAVLSLGAQTTGSGLSEVFTPVVTQAACFASGTHIETPDGEVPVECLREGQRVVTATGRTVPVEWLGHSTFDCVRHPRPQDIAPVRVAAGAFGPTQPRRDLVLSPDHAVFVDGVLIPARYLINGLTVTQQKVAAVTYWHVELPGHDVLLAEGLACESYLDTGNRTTFENSDIAASIAAIG